MRAMQELNTLKAATTDNGLHSNALHDDGVHDDGLNNGDALGGGQGARRASASAPSHERGRMGGGMGGMGGGAGGGAGGGGGGMGGAREQQQQREAAAETARLRVALSTAQVRSRQYVITYFSLYSVYVYVQCTSFAKLTLCCRVHRTAAA